MRTHTYSLDDTLMRLNHRGIRTWFGGSSSGGGKMRDGRATAAQTRGWCETETAPTPLTLSTTALTDLPLAVSVSPSTWVVHVSLVHSPLDFRGYGRLNEVCTRGSHARGAYTYAWFMWSDIGGEGLDIDCVEAVRRRCVQAAYDCAVCAGWGGMNGTGCACR